MAHQPACTGHPEGQEGGERGEGRDEERCKGEGSVRREGTEGETERRAEVRMSGKERGGTTIQKDITSNSPHPHPLTHNATTPTPTPTF